MLNILELKSDLYRIFKQIVMTYPHGPHQLNTFAVIDDGALFSSANLHKIYADYLNGFFWARDWAAAGADPNTICIEYPALTTEVKRLYFEDGSLKGGCFDLWVMISDQVDCRDCEHPRSIEEVDTDLQRMAMAVLGELNKFRQYILDGIKTWATPQQVDYLITNGLVDSVQNSCDSSVEYNLEPLEIVATDLGVPDKVRAVAFKLSFCGCRVEPLVFNYEPINGKQSAYAKCETC